MSAAVFEELKAEKIGILRIYETDNTIEPAPYKFFISASITGDNAIIKGLHDCNINMHDFDAVCKELKSIGVKSFSWTHNGKNHTKVIK
jgi:hypothetical protein